jgi:hypothetical protein
MGKLKSQFTKYNTTPYSKLLNSLITALAPKNSPDISQTKTDFQPITKLVISELMTTTVVHWAHLNSSLAVLANNYCGG